MPTMVKGAYSPQFTYSVADLKELSDYAYSLGVEIIYEVDVPGHAASW